MIKGKMIVSYNSAIILPLIILHLKLTSYSLTGPNLPEVPNLREVLPTLPD